MPICTIAAMRCTRIVWRPPPPASSFNACITLGRLKRTAGSNPKSTLTTRHSPDAIADTGRVEIDLLRNRHAQIPSSDRGNAEQHERAERAGAKRQQDRFEEQMLDQSPPIRAERRANRQLALAAGAADQHHAGDVQAHDQQHRSRQAEQDADHAPALGTAGRAHRACTARPWPP